MSYVGVMHFRGLILSMHVHQGLVPTTVLDRAICIATTYVMIMGIGATVCAGVVLQP